MKPLLFVLAMLLATATFAQTPGYPQSSSPPQTMPDRPLPPDQSQRQQEEMGPQSQAVPPAQVEQEIQQAFRAQPALSNTRLSAAANLRTVTVNGTVANENQHQLALRVAALHANGRRVVDDIKVPQ
ncbi:MAG TPA: BON domain-containing protein [Terriglobales bacterium]